MATSPAQRSGGSQVRTYRAASMQEALQEIRRTLGPDAAVLQTREVRRGWLPWLSGERQIEVVAATDVPVPSRFPRLAEPSADPEPLGRAPRPLPDDDSPPVPPAHATDYRLQFREHLKRDWLGPQSPVEELCSTGAGLSAAPTSGWPEALSQVYRELLAREVAADLARGLVERVRQDASRRDLLDPVLLRARVARCIEREFRVCGPLQVRPSETRVVALIGPTGVGKTTTVAKLAAHFGLRQRLRVGLITVDTYRIAAVEQLRTYADILNLTLAVASTPREIRAAIDRLSDQDLILIDTAGRSPHDVVQIHELRALLAEAEAHEVHLVLSAVASTACLQQTAAQFAIAGATSLLVTKLDEATGIGPLLSLVRDCRLPISYVTTGQSVPDDIQLADSRMLTRRLLGVDND